MMANFPTSIGEVTDAWLTESLRSSGVLDAGSVCGFDVEPIGVGVGIMGLLYRLHLHYDGVNAGPATAVLKVGASGEGVRHVARTFRFYEKEVGFYRHFGEVTPAATAACFAAEHDSEEDDFVLLLADVVGADVYSQIDGCPPAVAEHAARALARHHAAFVESPLFDRPEMSWLPFGSDPPIPEGVIRGVTDSWAPFREKFPELIGPEIETIMERYAAAVPGLLEILPGRPVTLMHGDYRLDNLFFRPHGDVLVIDWQICAKGVLAYDLAYFITQSLTVETRRAQEDTIIDAYFDELIANGVDHDRDDFMTDYRRTTMFCLCYPLQAGAVELANDRARDLVADMFQRAMAAIEDHDATEFLVS
jgi:phosphotransferase family enzyme